MSDFDFSSFTGQAKANDDTAAPEFFIKPVRQAFKSNEAGRDIFEDREFVRIRTPGLPRSVPEEEVTDEHRRRWPRHYEAFQRQDSSEHIEGTPLKSWPPVNRSRAEELAVIGIRSVEQLANVPDAALANMGLGARELREQAKTWLDAAKNGSAPIAKLINTNAEQATEIARLNAVVAGQAETISTLRGQLDARQHQPA